jgi:putative peptidoglycan lipid II flippase
VDVRDPGLVRYVVLSLPLVLGLGMQFSNEIAFRIFGSFLGVGGLASLNYSLRVMWALVGLFGQAVGIASFPYLTSLAAGGKLGEMNRVAFGVLKRVGLLVIPASAVLVALAPEIVSVLFQRGRFTAVSVAQTAPVLQYYLLGAFAFSAMTIVIRCFYALQNTWLPMVASTLAALAGLPVYWLFSRKWGAPGIALAGSVAVTMQLVALLGWWIHRHGAEAPVKALAKSWLKACAAGALAFTVAVCSQTWLWQAEALRSLGHLGSNLAVCAVAGGLALAAAVAVLRLLGSTELTEIWHKLRPRRAK